MKINVSLYEFYAMGINSLLKRAPWEAEERLTKYHESFLYEQRLVCLSMLFLLGEEHVPQSLLQTMPQEYGAQIRDSVNHAVFLRALKHYYRHIPSGDAVATRVMERMHSYISITREASAQNADPLEAITLMLAKRVPPTDEEQEELYYQRVQKIFNYTDGLINRSLKEKYEIV
jgi:hypothetical protein